MMPSAKIWVLEEKTQLAEKIHSDLRGLGYGVPLRLDSGKEAIQKIQSNPPDLVLIGALSHGEMDAIETARQIQARYNIPLVYLIDASDAKKPGLATLAQADGHLLHPIDVDTLHITIERALRKASSVKQTLDNETRFRKIFEHSQDAVFVICPTRNTILEVNPSACKMFGFTREELLSKQITDIHPEQKPTLNMFVQSVLKDGKAWSDQLTGLKKDGKFLSLEISASTIYLHGEVCILTLKRDITQRKQREEVLRLTQFTIDRAATPTFFMQSDARFFYVNEAACRILGYTRKELLSMSIHDIDSDALPENWPETWERLKSQRTFTIESHHRTKAGKIFPVEITSNYLAFEGNEYSCTFAHDIIARKQEERQQRLSAAIFDAASESIVVTDIETNILSINPAFTMLTGYTPEEVIGKPVKMLQSGRHDQAFFLKMWDTIQNTGRWQGEIWDKKKNGEIYPAWLSISSVTDENGKVIQYTGMLSDITQRKLDEKKLHFQATHDPLTDLANRTLLIERLSQVLKQGRRTGHLSALFFVDLDHFKQINDTLGHLAGDEILKETTARLLDTVRETDTVARTSGDEFLILFPKITHRRDVVPVAKKIIKNLSTFQVNDQQIFLGASIGIAIAPHDGEEVSSLLKHADMAMYKAKEAGRNRYHFYNQKMEKQTQERNHLEWDLRRALQRKELVMHYQPLVDLHSAKTVAVEALIRWNHPHRGLLFPGLFIPISEDSDLINEIGDWVLNTACSQVKTWQDRYVFDASVSVNVSSRQFGTGDVLSSVTTALEESGLSPEHLTIEMTESLMLDPAEEAPILKLNALKKLGVKLAVDDFGTGYSSLSYLSKYPIDHLKIDQSFIKDVSSNSKKKNLVEAIIRMGESLQLETVAEGIETDEALSCLKNLGCKTGQGYYFSKPVSAKTFETGLETRKV